MKFARGINENGRFYIELEGKEHIPGNLSDDTQIDLFSKELEVDEMITSVSISEVIAIWGEYKLNTGITMINFENSTKEKIQNFIQNIRTEINDWKKETMYREEFEV